LSSSSCFEIAEAGESISQDILGQRTYGPLFTASGSVN